AVTGTAVGLSISAFARSEEVATALVPIAVIPQIILAGLVAPLRGAVLMLARSFVTVYWGQQAIERLLPEDDLKVMLRESGVWSRAVAVILAHALVAALLSVIILTITGGNRRRS